MINYRKGDILTIWVTFGNQKLDQQLVIVKDVGKLGQKDSLRYALKPLEKGRKKLFYWSGKQMHTNSKLVLPASELASILYE